MASGTQKYLHAAALQSLQCRGHAGRHPMPAHGNQRAVHIKEGGAYSFSAARRQRRQLGKAVDMQLRRTLVKRESFVPQGRHNAARRRTCLHTVGGVLHDQTFLRPAPQPVHGETVNLGVRLAVGKFVAADDTVKQLAYPALRQDLLNTGPAAAACKGYLQPHLL